MRSRLPELGSLKIDSISTPDSTGIANETFFLRTRNGKDQGSDFVLRLESESYLYLDASLEIHYQMHSRLRVNSSVPIPEVIAFEEDPAVLGVRFFLMRRVIGQSPPDRPNFNYAGWLHKLSPAEREKIWYNAVRVMSDLHKTPLSDFSDLGFRTESANGLVTCFNYWRRYARWCDGYTKPLILAAEDWLEKYLPKSEESNECISWGDARLQNLLFDKTQCTAILDWDMVSMAGGEADLAWWAIADHKYTASRGIARLEGIRSPEKTIHLWESLMERKAKNMDWHLVFASYRQALISFRLQQLEKSNGSEKQGTREPSIGLQWLSCLLDLPLSDSITLPFVGLDR